MADAKTVKAKSTDLGKLNPIIHGLIGRKCWKLAFTYGGELTLHFGRQISYNHPVMSGKKTGQWRLGTRATACAVFSPQGSISSKERATEEVLEEKLKVLEGRKVTKINVSVPDNILTIAFGNDHLFQVIPTISDAKDTMSYWELFMPNHTVVTFGPGNSWSCRRSDVADSASKLSAAKMSIPIIKIH